MPVLGLSFTALVVASSPAGAALRCEAPGNLLRWPEERPVWELCWLYPGESSGPSGSGLELRDVRYRGVTVLARAQVPVVWAELGGEVPGCSGRCFRTWTWQASRFGVRGEVVPGYYEIDLEGPPAASDGELAGGTLTVCDRPAASAPGECPWGEAAACGEGVAIERWEEGFRLTTQLAAGWFRYAMRWTFHRDGTIEPRFGFARGRSACAEALTLDSAVWRLDLDVGGERNRVEPVGGDAEATTWRVTAAHGNLGYRLRAGAGDLGPRWWVTPHSADALTDAGRSCAFDPEALVVEPAPAEPAAAETDPAQEVEEAEEGDEAEEEDEADRLYDAVLWYRASAGGVAEAGCRWVGPTLERSGRWPPPRGDELFHDGFESGGLDAWDAAESATAKGPPSSEGSPSPEGPPR